MGADRAPCGTSAGNSDSIIRLAGLLHCLSDPFFAPDDWVPVPPDWKRNIVSGRGYDLAGGHGRALWERCVKQAVADTSTADEWTIEAARQLRYGVPQIVTPRLGQGSFRLAVLDAYGHACAVTTEHSLPVLEASISSPTPTIV